MPASVDRWDPGAPTRWVFLTALSVESALIVAAALIGWATGISPWSRLRADGIGVAVGIAATVPMLCLLGVIRQSRRGQLARLWKSSVQLLGEPFAECGPIQLTILATMAGFSEELLFRGVLQPFVGRALMLVGLSPWSAPWIANVVVSLIFAALHGVSISYFAIAFFISMYLGWLADLGYGLVPPVMAHALYDLVAIALVVKAWRAEARMRGLDFPRSGPGGSWGPVSEI